MLLFDILGSIGGYAAETVIDKVDETKENYNKYYEEYARRTENWDDERLKEEYKRVVSGSDLGRKAALLKILQERGLIKN